MGATDFGSTAVGEGVEVSRVIGVIEGVEIVERDDKSVVFTAKAAIDADGANGQTSGKAAYMVGNLGWDHLANGGMGMRDGKVVGVEPWFKDIVILNDNRQPKEFPGGIIASKTAYRYIGRPEDSPEAYVDSETIAYFVTPPLIRQAVRGVVLGCLCRATNIRNGSVVEGPVADVGPRRKIGEMSMAAAKALGINPSPRIGGTDSKIVKYEFFPGITAPGFDLKPA